eukprot:TRINITY_DN1261_c0_g1_i1.p1 TRINITY_DN1261_c0_g1~~TRINITY_DN1261_c0_g1_i1.p1  ORF type:complete len:260 (+),score=-68.44 TRINITY_DN1261_c0_g1_i1:682-1461(+)
MNPSNMFSHPRTTPTCQLNIAHCGLLDTTNSKLQRRRVVARLLHGQTPRQQPLVVTQVATRAVSVLNKCARVLCFSVLRQQHAAHPLMRHYSYFKNSVHRVRVIKQVNTKPTNYKIIQSAARAHNSSSRTNIYLCSARASIRVTSSTYSKIVHTTIKHCMQVKRKCACPYHRRINTSSSSKPAAGSQNFTNVIQIYSREQWQPKYDKAIRAPSSMSVSTALQSCLGLLHSLQIFPQTILLHHSVTIKTSKLHHIIICEE